VKRHRDEAPSVQYRYEHYDPRLGRGVHHPWPSRNPAGPGTFVAEKVVRLMTTLTGTPETRRELH
jgi:hypothetical protein